MHRSEYRVSLQKINYVKLIIDKLAEIEEVEVFPAKIAPKEEPGSWTTIDLMLIIYPKKEVTHNE